MGPLISNSYVMIGVQNDCVCSVGLQEAMELIPGKCTFVLGDIL